MNDDGSDLGLAILAVVVCLALGLAIALVALFLRAVISQRRGGEGDVSAVSGVRGGLFPVALLAMPIGASIGAWLVVGASDDWGRFVRAVGGACALCLVFVLAYGATTAASGRLGRWRPTPAVAVGIAVVLAIVAFVLVAAVLPEPVALALVVLTVLLAIAVIALLLAGGF